ncbi:glycosyltransferase [Pseudomonas silvicola]|nr:glycosyltransferase [Pseudomonas silvicola]
MNASINPVARRGNLMLDVRPHTSCDFHRIIMPYGQLQANPKAPVFVFNRQPSHGIHSLMAMKNAGIKIICDIDDHFEVGPKHVMYELFKKHNVAEVIKQSLQLADLVTCTNEVLAKVVKPYAKQVEILPNALPFDRGQFTLSQDTTSDRPMVYVAGTTHRHDMNLFAGRVNESALTIAGHNPEREEWRKIEALFGPDVRYKPETPIDSYMSLYDGHAIALAPLVDTEFNRCKSNLKVLEAGAKGIPIVVSDVHPYLNAKDFPAVDFAADAFDWADCTARLMDDEGYRDARGQELAAHVREHYHLDKINEIRRQIVEGIV